MPEGQAPEGIGTTATLPGSAAATAGITALGTPVTTPAAVTPAAVTTPGALTPPVDPNVKVFDEKYVQGLRDEAAANRVKAKELEDKLKAAEQKDLTESQKLAAKIAELEKANVATAQQARDSEIKSIAAALGCRKPELIVKLVEDNVEHRDLAKAVAAIKKDTPELFLNTIGSADGGSGGGAGSGAGKTPGENMNFLIRQAAGRG